MRRIALFFTLLALLVLTPASGWSTTGAAEQAAFSETAQGRDVFLGILHGTHVGDQGSGIFCFAIAQGNIALYTAVTRCTLTFVDGVTINAPIVRLPGVVATSGWVKLHKVAPYTACVTGQVNYLGGGAVTDTFCLNGS